MFDCPPSPPSCTEAWTSLGTGVQTAGAWPLRTTTVTASTGYELPPVACDLIDGSLWAYLGPVVDWDAWLSLPWTLLLDGLACPGDKGGIPVL